MHALKRMARTGATGIRVTATGAPFWFTVATVLTVLYATFPALQFWLLQALLNRGTSNVAGIGWLLVAIALVVGLLYPLSQMSNAAAQRMGLRVRVKYRKKLVRRASQFSPIELSKPSVINDLEAAEQAIPGIEDCGSKALQLIGAVGSSLFLTGALWSVDLLAGLLVAGALIPTIVAFSFVAKHEATGWPLFAGHERRGRYFMELLLQQRTATELSTLDGGAFIAARAEVEMEESASVLDRMISHAMRMELFSAICTATLFGLVIVRVVYVSGSVSGIAAAIVAMIAGLTSIRQCGYAAGTLISAAPKLESFERVVGRAVGLRVSENRVPVNGNGGPGVSSLRVAGLAVKYPASSVPAVRSVSLEIRLGEVAALVGLNGAGKSTVVNSIVGVREPTSGSIAVDGHDLKFVGDAERRALFGLLTQEFGRYELSVRESLVLASPGGADQLSCSDDRLWRALEFAELRSLVEGLPDGLDTQLGEQWGGTGISGGQWQRLALARLFVRNAPIWILDEPTSSLDAEIEQQLFDTLRAESGSRITLIVSHRVSTLQGMDRIYVMDNGRIVQSGTFDNLLLDERGKFYRMFRHQLVERCPS